MSAWLTWFRAPTAGSANCLVVEGAGAPGVDGVYQRTEQSCDGADVWRKKGTSFAIMRRGDQGWSITDLGGKPTDRWTLYALELYRVEQMPCGMKPPQLGWIAIEGKAPAPSLRQAKTSLPFLKESSDDALMTKPSRQAKGDLLLRARGGGVRRSLSETRLPRVQPTSRSLLQSSMVALGLPELPRMSQARRRKMPGQSMDSVVTFRVLLWRPSTVVQWGLQFSDGPFRRTGARIVSSVYNGSPLSRWNAWQQIRGRPELCVMNGDRLVKVDGVAAFYENEVGSQDGDLGEKALENAEVHKRHDTTAGCIVLDFARPAVRPAPPEPPQLDVWETEAAFIVSWEPGDTGLVRAWAVAIKDVTVGVWHIVDGATGIANLLASGAEHGALRPDVSEKSVWKGLAAGRPYAACIALLTDRGWSAFSELSRPAALQQRAFIDALLDNPYPPQEEEWDTRPMFTVPTLLAPGSTSPVALRTGPREFFGARRWLRLQTVYRGSTKGLGLKSTPSGRSLEVISVAHGSEVAKWYEREKGLKLHGGKVIVALRPGDNIVRVNGVSGAEAMLHEILREPNALALRFERQAGGSDGEEAGSMESQVSVFRVDTKLDEEASRLAEEVQWNVIMEAEEGLLSFGILENDLPNLEKLIHSAAIAAQYSSASRYAPLLKEAEKRLLLFRRRAEVEDAGDSLALGQDVQEGRAVMALKCALADNAGDPDVLDAGIKQFNDASQAVRTSKDGLNLINRARVLKSLWDWRLRIVRLRGELLMALQDALRAEFAHDASETESEADSEDQYNGGQLNVEGLATAIDEARQFEPHIDFDLVECEQVLQRQKETNVRVKVREDLLAVADNPRSDEAALLDALDKARAAGVDQDALDYVSEKLRNWSETSGKAAALDELFTAVRELKVHVEKRMRPGAGGMEQARVRRALAAAHLPANHELVEEAGVLLRKWEADNVTLRVEARLLTAVDRAKSGYKQSEPRAGDLLACAIATVAQQGVSADALGDAREVLNSWYESRKRRANRDLGYARQYRDEKFLAEAIEFGREAGVDEATLEDATFDLMQIRYEEEVNKLLVSAMEEGDRDMLEAAVQRAHQGYFTDDVNVLLQSATLQIHLTFWTTEFRNVLLTKRVIGLEEDVKTAAAILDRCESAKEAIQESSETIPEVVLRTLERDERGLKLVMPKTRDMAAVHTAEQAILKVLGAVEKYAADLPEVIKQADEQVPRGLNKKYVIEAKGHLKAYEQTVSELATAMAMYPSTPAASLKSAIIKARLAGAPKEQVEKAFEMLDASNPDLYAYAKTELELLLAKAEADDIDELDVSGRFLRLQDAADEARKLQPPLAEETLNEVQGYSLALASEKCLVEATAEAKSILSGLKAASTEEMQAAAKSLRQACKSAETEALEAVTEMIPDAEDLAERLSDDAEARADCVKEVKELCLIKNVPTTDLKRALVKAREMYLPFDLIEDAYTKLRRRKLEHLQTDLRAAMTSQQKAVSAGLWQRGLLLRAHESFSDWPSVTKQYNNLHTKSLVFVKGEFTEGAAIPGSFGTHRWRNNPYWVIKAAPAVEEEEHTGGGTEGKKKKHRKNRTQVKGVAASKTIRITVVVAEAEETPANLSVHAVRNRQDVATAAAITGFPLMLAPGPEVLASSTDDKGIPSLTFEMQPPTDEWPVFIVPSAPKGEMGPFVVIVESTVPVQLVEVAEGDRSPWKYTETIDLQWSNDRPHNKTMGGGRMTKKAAPLSWYRNPCFRVCVADVDEEEEEEVLDIEDGGGPPVKVVEIPEDQPPVVERELTEVEKWQLEQNRKIEEAIQLERQERERVAREKAEKAAREKAIEDAKNAREKGVSCLKKGAQAGEIVYSVEVEFYGPDEDGEEDQFYLGEFDAAEIIQVDEDATFRLKNPAGKESDWVHYKHFVYKYIPRAATPDLLPADIAEKLRSIFKRCDLGGDGQIDKREIMAIIMAKDGSGDDIREFFNIAQDANAWQIEQAFANLDKNGDCEIEWDEFRDFYVELRKSIQSYLGCAQIVSDDKTDAESIKSGSEVADLAASPKGVRFDLSPSSQSKNLRKTLDSIAVADEAPDALALQSAGGDFDGEGASIASKLGAMLSFGSRSRANSAKKAAAADEMRKHREEKQRLEDEANAQAAMDVAIDRLKSVLPSEVLKMLEDIFKKCDPQGDGSMSLEELKTVCLKDQSVADFFNLPRGTSNQAFRQMEMTVQKLDPDGSGEISWEEFRDYYMNLLKDEDKGPEPLFLAVLIPNEGRIGEPASVHMLQNKHPFQEKPEMVQNLRHQVMVSANVGLKKKQCYQAVAELGTAARLDSGEIYFVVPSLQTAAMKGTYQLHLFATEKITVERT
eukprot:TRINITY_DN24180_c0_g1_i1.p1 TRINITY_DN24180_c0_g1~~TRINITY_DN24180_c0_g1_i1.p1  ORF type:complete len:2350 (-),score=687.41 TRINITY_DN24180_c0_g1_i1:126-7175(-)